MRLSRSFGKTLRDAPADAELTSHQLLIRANFVRPVGAGIYAFMPLGLRVMRKLMSIMREEMDAIGAQEMWLPALHPAALWQATSRWDSVDVLMKLRGRGGRDYCLAPTHEEIVVDLGLREIESYRDLPQVLYHLSKKFRDEERPRGGLLRLREFVMKDAYSLDTDAAALDAFYPYMVQAYFNIFTRCAVPVQAISADVGAMGGRASHEFVVPHEQGEDTFISCTACDYAANVEAASFGRAGQRPSSMAPLQKIATPDSRTIAAVAAFLNVPSEQTIKAVFYWNWPWGAEEDAGRLLLALVRGDLEVSETKLLNTAGGGQARPATDAEISAAGLVPGYASAIGRSIAPSLKAPGLLVIADVSIEMGGDFIAGANEHGYHYRGVNYPRDFAVTLLADIAQATNGHPCPVCGAPLAARRAVEAGHCFKLGTRYSTAVGATFLDEDGRAQPIVMGSYGIGLDRLMAIIVELHHDTDGIIWPAAVAPYQVHLLHIGKGDDVRQMAEQVYTDLQAVGIDVLYDDRELSAGVKFKDADLIGLPWRVTVGARGLATGSVEVQARAGGEARLVPMVDLPAVLTA